MHFSRGTRHRDSVVLKAANACALAAMMLACSSGEPEQDDPALEAQQSVNASLQITLSPVAERSGSVEYALTNTGGEALRFVTRETALVGAYSDQFEVQQAGVVLPYKGLRVSFTTPRPEHYTEIGPGETLKGWVDLAELYDLQPGEYGVRARPRQLAVLSANTDAVRHLKLSVDPAPLVFAVDAPGEPLIEKQSADCVQQCERNCESLLNPGSIGLCQSSCPSECAFQEAAAISRACTAAENGTVATALATGQRMAADGATAVDSTFSYFTWFGARDPGRQDRVRSLLQSISNEIVGIGHLCLLEGRVVDGAGGRCDDGDFTALTGGGFGDTVGLCPSFFTADADQRAALMVHESSHHFGTQDSTDNNPANVIDLARNDPERAINNAYSYQFYALDFR